MKIAWIAILSIGLAVAAEEKVDFQRDVRPILSDKCFFCHGFDPETREADLRLDTPEGAYEDLGGYSAVVPGKVKESELYLRITSKKEIIILIVRLWKFRLPIRESLCLLFQATVKSRRPRSPSFALPAQSTNFTQEDV
ncbi:hypothetical protein N9Z97_03200 [Akkermansiaceae bacterium]|nr:hypothetical protein [Akkermansiaceae bacterium]